MLVLYYFNESYEDYDFANFNQTVLQKDGVREMIEKFKGKAKNINITVDIRLKLLGSIRFDFDLDCEDRTKWMAENLSFGQKVLGFYVMAGRMEKFYANEGSRNRISYAALRACRRRFLKTLATFRIVLPARTFV